MHEFLVRLKEETAALHQSSEMKVFKPDDKTWYPRLLILNRQFYSQVELFYDRFDNYLAALSLANRRKSALAERDLSSLGVYWQKEPYLFTEVTLPTFLGFMYVAEGSTLGARVMLKQLCAMPDYEGHPFALFQGYGDETGIYWKQFTEFLGSWVTKNPSHADHILNGAKTAFLYFIFLADSVTVDVTAN